MLLAQDADASDLLKFIRQDAPAALVLVAMKAAGERASKRTRKANSGKRSPKVMARRTVIESLAANPRNTAKQYREAARALSIEEDTVRRSVRLARSKARAKATR